MIDQISLIKELYPLNRLMLSDDYNKSLDILAKKFPLKINAYPTGQKCWTWKIPSKWKCLKAYIETLDGRKLLDYEVNPFCVAAYSISLDQVVSKEELFNHLFTHPYLEDAVPFIFYYYQKNWGFCCSKKNKDLLIEDKYHVCIESIFVDGDLRIGEYYLPGESSEEFVLCAHLDHPFQVNDGLSGVATALAVMELLQQRTQRRFSYRLLITTETIGSIAWLSQNELNLNNIIGGLFLEMTGLTNSPALQLSYLGNSVIDECFEYVHLRSEDNAWVAPYLGVVGNDERQFNAPGVRIPMLSYSRALPWGHQYRPYKEYHSDKDNLEITNEQMLKNSAMNVLAMIDTLEENGFPKNNFKGEPCFSEYNLSVDRNKQLLAHRNMLKIIQYVDGNFSILQIAKKLSLSFSEVNDFITKLEQVGLVTINKNYLVRSL